ncbi:MAG: peptidase M28 [Robiginitomaculum sp.]|nr:MAG: peptidase M28 [Robiginitomaculum sp.]
MFRAPVKLVSMCACLAISGAAQAQEAVDLDMVNRIRDEGFNHSHVMDNLGYLTDVIGPRLTGSPQLKEANNWTLEQFEGMGLKNGELDGFDFGRGWSFSKSVVTMAAPREAQLYALPLGWHPGTNGPVTGDVMKVSISSEKDFEKYEGKLEGKIVLLSKAKKSRPGKDPRMPTFKRLTDEDLTKRAGFNVPVGAPQNLAKFEKKFLFEEELYTFLQKEGAVAAIKRSPRDAALIEASAYLYKTGHTPQIPGVSMSTEDYERILRLLDRDKTVSISLDVVAQYYDEDPKAYNTIAEIPGKGSNPEVVMAGAHLDSWFVGDGAADNGAGSAVIMEAARILSALNIKPKRTIRFALWGGEEQGLYGSAHYVRTHFGDRPVIDDEERAQLPSFFWFNETWPITTKPEHKKLSAYFNFDNGSGKIRGIYGEGNAAVRPIFESWFKPFEDLGASTISLNKTGGTDHLYFQWVGLPAFQFIQDPLDYGARIHHSQIDTLDHVSEADLKQASVIMATFLYNAAMRDERLPRKPLPTEPPKKKKAKDDEDEG